MDNDIRERFEDNERRIAELEAKLQTSKKSKSAFIINQDKKVRYKSNGTTAKIAGLIDEGFFDLPKTLNEVVIQFKTKDYHFKVSDLTMSVRQLMRHEVLRREKNGKQWAYIKI